MLQLRGIKLSDLVFIDTETAREEKELKEGTPAFDAWEYMVKRQAKSGDLDIIEDYMERSGLYSEFARLVCISVGRIKDGKLYITTYKDKDEKKMLEAFMGDLDMVTKYRPNTKLVGHSVKGFDIPFLFRRALVNQILPNKLIDVGGLKPWELTALDTKDLWKASGYYNSSLIAVCLALKVPSPKSDITGAEVGDVYHNEGEAGLTRIAEYCERDVMAVANVVLRFRFEDIFMDYEAVEPKERVKLGLVEKIAKTGVITKEQKEAILAKVKDESIENKERQIKLLKSALLLTKSDLDEELELAILSA